MKQLLAFLLLAGCLICRVQGQQIKTGSTVYIEPMGGYETYLAAAIAKKHVPLIVVADKDKADYLITSSVSHYTPSQPAVVVNNSAVNNTTVNSSDVTNNNSRNDTFERGFAIGAAQYVDPGSTSASISVIDRHSS